MSSSSKWLRNCILFTPFFFHFYLSDVTGTDHDNATRDQPLDAVLGVPAPVGRHGEQLQDIDVI